MKIRGLFFFVVKKLKVYRESICDRRCLKINSKYQYHEQRNKDIWEKYNDGLKSAKSSEVIKKLADEYFVSYGTLASVIRKQRKKHGIIYYRGGQPHPERDAKIVKMADDGVSFEKIAKEAGVSRSRISQIVYGHRRSIDPSYIPPRPYPKLPSEEVAARNRKIIEDFHYGKKNYVILADKYHLSQSMIRKIIAKEKLYEKEESI